ncbi:hypothetical protein [Falsibacillus pallidus]|uniref:hypothetical protein n=1 Tax=Falsibacillus pallidus TaxID=493781 RepID=UPI003D9680A2
MSNGLWKWTIPILLFVVAYRYRYRVMNVMLGNFILRKLIVKFAMNIPGFRSKMIQSTFL